MSRTFRSITLTLALLVLCSSATYALPSAGRLNVEDAFAALWARVVGWFGAPASVEEKAESQMDPNGVPVPDTGGEWLGAEADAGSQMDPDGYK